MGQIDWRRVLLGGIVAGLIIDVFEWILHGLVLGPQWRQVMAGLGRPLQETWTGMAFYVLLGLAYGFAAMWVYAAIRPRYGAGPRTALYAGLGVWLLGDCLPTMSLIPMGLFPRRLLAIAMLVGLVEFSIATLAGAWLYRESGKGSESIARAA